MTLYQEERAHRTDHCAASRISSRTGGRLHTVIFKNREIGTQESGTPEKSTQSKGENTGSYSYAEAPPGFQTNEEVRQAHNRTQQTPHQNSPGGKLRQFTAVDISKPLQLYIGGGFPLRVNTCKIVQESTSSARLPDVHHEKSHRGRLHHYAIKHVRH